MPTHNPENERIKRAYFEYMGDARRLSEHSVDAAAAALARFENYTRHRDFKKFHIQQAIGFKRMLAEEAHPRTGKQLSASTMLSILNACRAFFHWLAGQHGYRSRLTYSDAEYFAMSEKEARVAKVTNQRPVPSIEEILHVLRSMPDKTDIELRNRAVVALTLLTGARDGAIASLKIKHLDMAQGRLIQDPREVRTKFSKLVVTWFFPIEEARAIVTHWIDHVTKIRFFGATDPLFPATRVTLGPNASFQADGLTRSHWSNASPIRNIFKEAFEAAGLPYANPHSFRKTLVQLGQQLCQTPEEFKAWSQNLGHEQVLVTFTSYGEVAPERQAEVLRRIGNKRSCLSDTDVIERLRQIVRDAEG